MTPDSRYHPYHEAENRRDSVTANDAEIHRAIKIRVARMTLQMPARRRGTSEVRWSVLMQLANSASPAPALVATVLLVDAVLCDEQRITTILRASTFFCACLVSLPNSKPELA
ncbi:hypothetical protein [Rhodopirellula sallentina]|uniref:Uncharacterized protein n=1 Tax=Rhodopirellula sallentina SM41 TaxID=1263870 RepID=M5UIE1_9BACT|nr:hypothetical protein [Rhodopirellula sallentina]EMI57616.1 hypothetical protein RSSM_00962 [Rhodopirellula sallentina SM41]